MSWTLSFLRKWVPIMGLRSAIVYRDVFMRAHAGQLRHGSFVCLRMKRPFRGEVFLRENNSDLMTFTEIIDWGVYRPAVASLPNVKTVIDLGANVGLASLYLAAAWPECRIVAVEPNRSTFDVLTRNLAALVQSGRCEVLNAAIWSRETILAADSSIPSDKFNWFKVQETASTPASDTCEGVSMTALMQRFGVSHIDLLKVDIEGAETELFSGDLSWLARTDAIAIEFHKTESLNTREICRFDELMTQNGFSAIQEHGHTVLASRPLRNAMRMDSV
jgi:FkbM family methyltransferase